MTTLQQYYDSSTDDLAMNGRHFNSTSPTVSQNAINALLQRNAQFMAQGRAMGLTGDALTQFVNQQQAAWGKANGIQPLTNTQAIMRGPGAVAMMAGLAMGGGALLGAGGGTTAGATDLAAADAAGGLLPEYGTTAAYNAGIGAGGTTAATAPTLLADAGTATTDVTPELDASGAPASGPGSAGQPYDMGRVTVSAPANTAPIQTLSNTPVSSITGITPGSAIGASSGTSLSPALAEVAPMEIPQLSGADLGAIQAGAAGTGVSPTVAAGGTTALAGATGAAAAGAGGAAVNGAAGDPAPAPAPSSPQDIQLGPNTPTTTGGGYTVDENGNVVGNAAGGASAAAGGAGTALSRIMGGNATAADWASVMGMGGATALSAYGANQQANTLKGMYDTYLGLGAPSRSRYEASFQPGFDITQDPGLKSAMESSTDALMRRASVGGNPAGNPSVLAEIQKYTTGNVALPYLEQYRGQNASTGGYGAYNASAPATGGAAVGATGNVYSDIGRGAANIFSPQPTMQQFFQQMKGLT